MRNCVLKMNGLYLLAFYIKYDDSITTVSFMLYKLDSKTVAISKECDTPISVMGSEISLPYVRHYNLRLVNFLTTF